MVGNSSTQLGVVWWQAACGPAFPKKSPDCDNAVVVGFAWDSIQQGRNGACRQVVVDDAIEEVEGGPGKFVFGECVSPGPKEAPGLGPEPPIVNR